ncbi:MAG: FAD-dependent oxidoreductase [Anaerolineae bacterium]|nr:FAD-binding oxidoreductase [Anaerolineae bacterium]MCX8067297.1 FAD-binding oxidoreductase [Anaerolineae bacterium]MDW7990843.1 FAD-dependent oxidoreductase [Anaerolineae bacterium]
MGNSTSSGEACDVAVVGAGIVGAAVAARLAQRGLKVAVLEAQQVAGGATGRSAGIVTTGLPGYYTRAVQTFGREAARTLWALTVEGRELLAEAARSLGVVWERTGSLLLALTPEEAESLRMSAEMLREDGFAPHWEKRDPLGKGFLGALRWADDGVVDAAALTCALLASTPVTVHSGTEALGLETNADGIRIWAYRRTLRCSAVVLATNGYAPLLGKSLSRWTTPGYAWKGVTESASGSLPTPCLVDYGYVSLRPLSDGRLMVSAWRPPGAFSHDPDEALRRRLARILRRYFPEAARRFPERRSGIVGCTPDGIPVVGSLSQLPGVYFALGLGGCGLNLAFVVAERLVNLLLDGTSPGILGENRQGK